MRILLVADKDLETRQQMAHLFADAGYQVRAVGSVHEVLQDILKRNCRVLLLGSELGDLLAVELIPLLKKCNRDLTIILVSDENSLPLLRKVRREGIFYHALKPVNPEDRDELRLAVQCAFEKTPPKPVERAPRWLRQIEAHAF